jgi:hypothetical protein
LTNNLQKYKMDDSKNFYKGKTMKKLVLGFIVILISFVLQNANPGQDKYADVKDLLAKQTNVFEEYIKACENVKNAKDVVVLINNFKEGFKALTPDLKTLVKKYGDLNKLLKDNPPEELKPGLKKIEELSIKVAEVSMKLEPYAQDPEVLKAQQEFFKAMKEMKEIVKPKTEGEKKEN